MPPPPPGRRRTGYSSRNPNASVGDNSASPFQKPNLPSLQGTPSSRRQYSYGAQEEPLPSRPGQGLKRDISSAVRNALTRPNGEEDGNISHQGKTRRLSTEPQTEIREDGTADAPHQERFRPSYLSGPVPSMQPVSSFYPFSNTAADGSDGDDARSFGLESDLYVDATIESTSAKPLSASVAQPSQLRQVQTSNVASVDITELHRPGRRAPSEQDNEDDVALVRRPSQVGNERMTNASAGTSSHRAVLGRPPQLLPSFRPQPSQRQEQDEDDDEGEDEEEDEGDEDTDMVEEDSVRSDEDVFLTRPSLRHVGTANTPAPRHLMRTRHGGPSPTMPRRQLSLGPSGTSTNRGLFAPAEQAARSMRAKSAPQNDPHGSSGRRTGELRSGASVSSNEGSEAGRWLSRANAASNFSNLFAHAKFLASSSPFRFAARYPSDESERNAAIERDIDAAEAEMARRRHQRARTQTQRRWRQQLDWLSSLWPFTRSSRFRGARPAVQSFSNFLRFLNPLTYFKALVWLATAILDCIMRLIHYIIPDDLWENLSSVFEFLPHAIAGLLAFVLAFTLATQLGGSADGHWFSDTLGASRRTFGDATHKLYEFVPTLSWPRRDRWVDIDDLWDNEGAARDKVEVFLSRMEDEFLNLQRARSIHEASLKKLESIVPSIVHMESRDGKPVISQEFWHAIRDLIHEDGAFLVFDRVGTEYQVSSERQWRAIASLLVRDPTFTAKLNMTLDEFEGRISGRMTTFWDSWVKDNDDKIARMLGSAVDQVKSAGSQREFEQRLSSIVEAQLSSQKHRGQIVTRDEFLRHLESEFAARRAEVRTELQHLQPQLHDMVKQSMELLSKDAAPDGMGRDDLAVLVNGIVRKTLADADLEALAKGSIHRHWDTDLRHQINYFAVGAGAVVDAKHSSSTWDPRREGIVSQERYQSGYRGSKPLPPVAALNAWHDAGDCWCAARSVNHRGNPHGASLAIQLRQPIIPQHVVVEHILPGATTEPGARPKVIEVYAAYDDSQLRDRLLDFAAVFFPDDAAEQEADWDFTPAEYPSRFVKISRFVYDAAHTHDGVYVHRLSSELMDLGAQTDHVILRAVSNYGARNHTCFYRVRLYGASADSDAWL